MLLSVSNSRVITCLVGRCHASVEGTMYTANRGDNIRSCVGN